MFITGWIRAAVAGATVDGREIKEQYLMDMASAYSPDTYAAQIWLEHMRGIVPDGLFKSLGSVSAAKVERIKDGGALDGRLGFYVRLAPHADLVAMVRNGQKVHLSVEIAPDFAKTGKAYLMGVGVTDSPASLGVGAMKFSASSRQENLFSEPVPTVIDLPQASESQHFSLMLVAAMQPVMDKLNTVSQQYQTINDNLEKIIELATPIAGNGKRSGDREPHGGGTSSPNKHFY